MNVLEKNIATARGEALAAHLLASAAIRALSRPYQTERKSSPRCLRSLTKR
jgi:hypothetical protein